MMSGLSVRQEAIYLSIHLTDTGRVVIRPDRKSIVRERRKLKKLKIKLDNGELEFEEVNNNTCHGEDISRSLILIKLFKIWISCLMTFSYWIGNRSNIKRKGGNLTMSNMEKSKVQLADGTVLSLRLNGTEYESDTPIADEVLSEENLSNVTIDDVNKGKMKLNSKYPFGSGTRFSLREMTEDEKTIERLNAELTQTQVGLAEVFEMLTAAQ